MLLEEVLIRNPTIICSIRTFPESSDGLNWCKLQEVSVCVVLGLSTLPGISVLKKSLQIFQSCGGKSPLMLLRDVGTCVAPRAVFPQCRDMGTHGDSFSSPKEPFSWHEAQWESEAFGCLNQIHVILQHRIIMKKTTGNLATLGPQLPVIFPCSCQIEVLKLSK